MAAEFCQRFCMVRPRSQRFCTVRPRSQRFCTIWPGVNDFARQHPPSGERVTLARGLSGPIMNQMADDLRFEWNEANISHIARHKVTPKEAEQVLLNDPFDVAYEVVDGEQRWTSIGHTDDLRVLLVVWTVRRNDVIRVVTAREATEEASRTYLRQKGFLQ